MWLRSPDHSQRVWPGTHCPILVTVGVSGGWGEGTWQALPGRPKEGADQPSELRVDKKNIAEVIAETMK